MISKPSRPRPQFAAFRPGDKLPPHFRVIRISALCNCWPYRHPFPVTVQDVHYLGGGLPVFEITTEGRDWTLVDRENLSQVVLFAEVLP
jgi:hypothetical protein